MTQAATLNEILEGDNTETEQVGQAVEQTAIATKEPDPDAAKVEETEPTAEKDGSWTKAAVLDERRKRQTTEEQLKEVQSELKALKEGKTQTDEPVTIEQRLLAERVNLSREMMLDKEDYIDMETVFIDLAKADPQLVAQMTASPNPAKFAYQKAKDHLEYQEFLEFKKTGKTKGEKVEAESEVEKPSDVKRKAALKVPDLNSATSASSGHKGVRRESLDDLYDK